MLRATRVASVYRTNSYIDEGKPCDKIAGSSILSALPSNKIHGSRASALAQSSGHRVYNAPAGIRNAAVILCT